MRLCIPYENSKCKIRILGCPVKTTGYRMQSVAREHNVDAMQALPGWLRNLDQSLGPSDRLVKSGWVVLHTAALRGGNLAGLRDRSLLPE